VGAAYVMRSTGGGLTLIPLRAFATPEDEKRFRELAAGRTRLSL
jgi:hypothetical protein